MCLCDREEGRGAAQRVLFSQASSVTKRPVLAVKVGNGVTWSGKWRFTIENGVVTSTSNLAVIMEPPNLNWEDSELDFSTPAPPRDFGVQNGSQREQIQPHPTELRLLQLHEWDPKNSPSDCARYNIEWTLYLEGKIRRSKLTDDTERNVTLAPLAYWQDQLNPKIDAFIKDKQGTDTYTAKEVKVVVSSPGTRSGALRLRSKTDTDIKWNQIEEQLIKLSPMIHAGKELKVEIEIEYKVVKGPGSSTTKKGGRSQTIAQLKAALSVQEENKAEGRKTAFSSLFPIFECPQLGCKIGPYCWRDPDTMVRYKVETGILQLMWKHMQEGKIDEITCHDDVPKYIRDEIMQERTSAKRKDTHLPPINITNVLPENNSVAAHAQPPRKKLKFDGITNEDVDVYCNWHLGRTTRAAWQDGFRKARDLTLEHGITLKQLYEAPKEEVNFFVSNGCPRGLAYQWVTEVECWKEQADVRDE